jgi:hypothetical protein
MERAGSPLVRRPRRKTGFIGTTVSLRCKSGSAIQLVPEASTEGAFGLRKYPPFLPEEQQERKASGALIRDEVRIVPCLGQPIGPDLACRSVFPKLDRG